MNRKSIRNVCYTISGIFASLVLIVLALILMGKIAGYYWVYPILFGFIGFAFWGIGHQLQWDIDYTAADEQTKAEMKKKRGEHFRNQQKKEGEVSRITFPIAVGVFLLMIFFLALKGIFS